jgi:hypothetical protein
MRRFLLSEPGDTVVAFVVIHLMLGAFAGALCASIVLLLDVGHLRTLLAASDVRFIGLALLYGGFMLTFASVICGSALMQLSGRETT